jgi:4-amino-4-deoxy-L-arabinose transferase-like glycosyltransferase
MSSLAISSGLHADRLCTFPAQQRLKIRELVCLVAIVAAFLIAEIHNARLRPFWFDELATLFVATQPTVGAMFRSMPSDGNPPLYFLLARLCLQLPVNPELGLRLPSVLALPASALAVFIFVRRITSFRFGLLSMCMLLGSSIGDRYGVEARPYALLMLFTALLLCFWQSARIPSDRRWALPGIALCTSGAILSHQYGIIYVVLPIVTGEAIRWIVRKHVDVGVLLCIGLWSLTILWTYPPMLHAQALLLSVIRSADTFSARPGWADLGTYERMYPLLLPSLFLFVALAWALGSAFIPRRKVVPERSFSVQPEDLAVADVLTMFVPIMVLLTHLGTKYFIARYAIGSALGIALLGGILAAYAGTRWRFANGLVSLLVLYCVTAGMLSLWIPAKQRPPVDYAVSIFAVVPGTEPIVVASALEFMPSWWYSDRPTRRRLHYLSDLQSAKVIPNMIPEYSLFLDRHQTPMQMEDYGSFLRTHRTFLVYSAGLPGLEWLGTRLLREGWDLKLIASSKRGKLFRATAALAQHPTSAAPSVQ